MQQQKGRPSSIAPSKAPRRQSAGEVPKPQKKASIMPSQAQNSMTKSESSASSHNGQSGIMDRRESLNEQIIKTAAKGVIVSNSAADVREHFDDNIVSRHIYSEARREMEKCRSSKSDSDRESWKDAFGKVKHAIREGSKRTIQKKKITGELWANSCARHTRERFEQITREAVEVGNLEMLHENLAEFLEDVEDVEIEYDMPLSELKDSVLDILSALEIQFQTHVEVDYYLDSLRGEVDQGVNVEQMQKHVDASRDLTSKATDNASYLLNHLRRIIVKPLPDTSTDAHQLLSTLPDEFVYKMRDKLVTDGPENQASQDVVMKEIRASGADGEAATKMLAELVRQSWDELAQQACKRMVRSAITDMVDLAADVEKRIVDVQAGDIRAPWQLPHGKPDRGHGRELSSVWSDKVAIPKTSNADGKQISSLGVSRIRSNVDLEGDKREHIPAHNLSPRARLTSSYNAVRAAQFLGLESAHHQDIDKPFKLGSGNSGSASEVPDEVGEQQAYGQTPLRKVQAKLERIETSDGEAGCQTLQREALRYSMTGTATPSSQRTPRAKEKIEDQSADFSSPANILQIVDSTESRGGLVMALKELYRITLAAFGGVERAAKRLSTCAGALGGNGMISISRFHAILQGHGFQRSCEEICVLFQALGVVACTTHATLTVQQFTRLERFESCLDEVPKGDVDKLHKLFRTLHLRRVLMTYMTFEDGLLVQVYIAKEHGDSDERSLETLLNACRSNLQSRNSFELAKRVVSKWGLHILIGVVLCKKTQIKCRLLAIAVVILAIHVAARAAAGLQVCKAKIMYREDMEQQIPADLEANLSSGLWAPILEFLDPEPGPPQKLSGTLLTALHYLLDKARIPNMVLGSSASELTPNIISCLKELHRCPPSPDALLKVVAAFHNLQKSRDALRDAAAEEISSLAAAFGGCRLLREKIAKLPNQDSEFALWGERMLRSWRIQRLRLPRQRLLSTSQGNRADDFGALSEKLPEIKKLDLLVRADLEASQEGFPTRWPVAHPKCMPDNIATERPRTAPVALSTLLPQMVMPSTLQSHVMDAANTSEAAVECQLASKLIGRLEASRCARGAATFPLSTTSRCDISSREKNIPKAALLWTVEDPPPSYRLNSRQGPRFVASSDNMLERQHAARSARIRVLPALPDAASRMSPLHPPLDGEHDSRAAWLWAQFHSA